MKPMPHMGGIMEDRLLQRRLHASLAPCGAGCRGGPSFGLLREDTTALQTGHL